MYNLTMGTAIGAGLVFSLAVTVLAASLRRVRLITYGIGPIFGIAALGFALFADPLFGPLAVFYTAGAFGCLVAGKTLGG